MYWSSPLVANAVALGLVEPHRLRRLDRRVRRRTREMPACDLIWAEELVRAQLLTRYQARSLLTSADAATADAHRRAGNESSPLKVGPYIVLNQIGGSDLGDSFRCCRGKGSETLVVKRLAHRWTITESVHDRITQETQRWVAVNDPRVVTAEWSEPASDAVALVSRCVEGRSLADWFLAGRRMSPAAAFAFVRELISLLATADAQGLVHGNLRPSNLFLDERGQLRVTDAGVRRVIPGAGLLERRDLPPDCYDHTAPEVTRGQAEPDAASDMYSVGCLFYHMVTGRPPYFGGDAARKCAAHTAARLQDPRCLGIEISCDMRSMLEAMLQPDRSRRVRSYNELLSRISPSNSRSAKGTHRELRRMRSVVNAASPIAIQQPLPSAAHRWAKWAAWTAAAATLIVALVHGSHRLLPLLTLRATTKSVAIVPDQSRKSPARNASRDATTVTALWNATEDLRRAYQSAAAHDTITLKSPGPFLIDAIEIAKPITLRGTDDVRPLFVGGPGSGLRVLASDVRFENVHFLRVEDELKGQTRRDAKSVVEVLGDRVAFFKCSFQEPDDPAQLTDAILWKLPPGSDGSEPRTMEVRDTLFRQTASAIAVEHAQGQRISLENSVHMGSGPLIRSTSGVGKSFESLDVSLSRVTVYGAGAMEHSFPHPLDDMVPLRVDAQNSFLISRDQQQPIFTVRYAAQPAMLMPKVSWSGSGTVCPADATVLNVIRGPDATPWRATGIAAWEKYWGSHPTGLLGVRLAFASATPRFLNDIPKLESSRLAGVGAVCSQNWYPLPVTMEQLPVLLGRASSP